MYRLTPALHACPPLMAPCRQLSILACAVACCAACRMLAAALLCVGLTHADPGSHLTAGRPLSYGGASGSGVLLCGARCDAGMPYYWQNRHYLHAPRSEQHNFPEDHSGFMCDAAGNASANMRPCHTSVLALVARAQALHKLHHGDRAAACWCVVSHRKAITDGHTCVDLWSRCEPPGACCRWSRESKTDGPKNTRSWSPSQARWTSTAH